MHVKKMYHVFIACVTDARITVDLLQLIWRIILKKLISLPVKLCLR